jgi:hypothetical protein
MSAASATLAGRRAAEALMLDAGTAKRPTTGWQYDAGTGAEVQASDVLFSSRCKVASRALVAREQEVGGRTSTTVRLEIHLPADSTPLRVGDLFVMDTVSPASLSQPGRTYRITGLADGTFRTAARYEVEVTA